MGIDFSNRRAEIGGEGVTVVSLETIRSCRSGDEIEDELFGPPIRVGSFDPGSAAGTLYSIRRRSVMVQGWMKRVEKGKDDGKERTFAAGSARTLFVHLMQRV